MKHVFYLSPSHLTIPLQRISLFIRFIILFPLFFSSYIFTLCIKEPYFLYKFSLP